MEYNRGNESEWLTYLGETARFLIIFHAAVGALTMEKQRILSINGIARREVIPYNGYDWEFAAFEECWLEPAFW